MLLFALVAGFHASAHAQTPADPLEISVVTFSPGAIYWERFGHNAILVRDPADGSAIAYNYGIFDFNQKNFLLNFARGRMRYRIDAQDFGDDLRYYRAEGRRIVEQRLDLSAAQALRLRDFLEWNARPENAQYPYDYFTSNCSTRVRDALDRALGGALRRQTEGRPSGLTYRFEVARLMAPQPLLMLGMDLGLGPAADRPLDLWQAGFIPARLMEALRGVNVGDNDGRVRPLVSGETVLAEGRLPAPPEAKPDLRLPFLAVGLALAAALLLLARRREHAVSRLAFSSLATSFTLVCGLAGLVLAGLWGLTEHWAAWRNQNLLLFDPLCLLLLPACIAAARAQWRPGRRVRWLAGLIALGAGLAAVIHLLPGLAQANLQWVLLALPAHGALAWVSVSKRA